MGKLIMFSILSKLPRLPGQWRRLAIFLAWLCVGLTSFASLYYSFGEAFSCDDGLKTGAACKFDYGAFYLSFLTFCGVIIWGLAKLGCWLSGCKRDM